MKTNLSEIIQLIINVNVLNTEQHSFFFSPLIGISAKLILEKRTLFLVTFLVL